MEKIKCNSREFNQINNNNQLYKIFDKELDLKFLEDCILIDDKTGEELEIQITRVNKYDNILDIIDNIDILKFGNYSSKEEFLSFIKNNYQIDNGFLICRIKKKEHEIDILDKKLLELIDKNTLVEEKLGLSGSLVYRVKMINGKDAILKIQDIKRGNSLKEEYEVLKFLKDKIRVADVYYYNIYQDNEYLLREYIKGEPLFKFNNFGYKLGQELKNIHKNYIKDCQFNKFSVENLLKHALQNIDMVYKTRSTYFKDYSKEELIKFLHDYTPKDDALVHGDFSLPNILVDNDIYYYIDLGNVSISTKYFDIYDLKNSLKINHCEQEYEEFLRGYGIKDYNEIFLRWMELIAASYD